MDSGSQTYEEDPDTGVEIEVKNPCVAKDGAMSKKYIIYDVEGTDKDGNFKVKRRFKDFDELRTKLVESWPGILIPPLPEKKVQGNTDSEFVLERKGLLDYFIKRCSKLSHIYYSDVMQVFLKSSDEQFKKEFGTSKPFAPIEVLNRYKELFPTYATKELKDEVETEVKKKFNALEKTLDFYKNFVNICRWYNRTKKKNSLDYANFIKLAVSDYKRNLSLDAQQVALAKYNTFLDTCTQDEVKEFYTAIKELSLEFQALFEVKQALRKIFNEIEDTKKKQSEINKELAKVNTTEGDVIKTGLFGKAVSKAELSKELTDKVNHTTEELDALSKLRGVIFNILYYREFPRIIASKNKVMDKIIRAYQEKRKSIIQAELDMLKEIETHYKPYATVKSA